jgi:hypothetical protein
MPWELIAVRVAERFGVLPWSLDDEPADRVYYYLGVMGIEADMQRALDGLEKDEPLILEGDDD